MKMSTDEFGKLWLSCSNDAKQNLKISPSQGSLLVVLNILQQKLKLHIVDIIGKQFKIFTALQDFTVTVV